jgi:hypothetical protein
MREVIYLAVSRQGVSKMTKNLPQLGRGEIPVKLIIDVTDSAFGPPVLEQLVTITDWREGIGMGDLQFREAIITEAEAAMIRQQRLDQMRRTLAEHGYTVTPPEPGGDDDA